MVPVQAAEAELVDISGTEWYAKEVIEMVNSGVITGLPDKTFGASQTISGAEFVTIVARAVSAPTGAADGHWAGLTMQSAKAAGWFTDAEIMADTYDYPVSRQQVAMILVKAYEGKLKKVSSLPLIEDKYLIIDRFIPYVEQAYTYELFKGDEEGNFNPFDNLTRAEAAVLIYRTKKNAETPIDTSKDIYELVKSCGKLTPTGELSFLAPVDTTIKGIEVLRAPIGSGILIKMNEVDGGYYPNSRALVKELLAIAYPTSSEEAYTLVINTMLDRVFESKIPGWNNSGAIRYFDNRKFSTALISSGDKAIRIYIGDYGDYADYELNATSFPDFAGYVYRGGSAAESQRISEEQIVKYGISKEEMGKNKE